MKSASRVFLGSSWYWHRLRRLGKVLTPQCLAFQTRPPSFANRYFLFLFLYGVWIIAFVRKTNVFTFLVYQHTSDSIAVGPASFMPLTCSILDIMPRRKFVRGRPSCADYTILSHEPLENCCRLMFFQFWFMFWRSPSGRHSPPMV